MSNEYTHDSLPLYETHQDERYVVHMNGSCLTYERVMTNLQICQRCVLVPIRDGVCHSCYTCTQVMPHILMSHVKFKRVISHV